MPQETLKYIISIEAKNAEEAARKIGMTAKEIEEAGLKMRKAGESSKTLAENIVRLGARALLTIPIWQALRLAMTSVTGTFSDGVKRIIELDEALINAKNEILGTVSDVDGFLNKLRSSAESLAQVTGIAAPQLVETFRQFATAGIEAETSLAGMDTAAKGAVATMGDSIELGRLLADVYNQMGDRITEVQGAQNKFNLIMSTIASLMPTNTFSIKEFGDALHNFLGTAKAANLTLDQTFVLVATSATAMQRGARGGTQLASAFSQLADKMGMVRDFLQTDLKGKSQFEIFFDVIKKSADVLKQSEGLEFPPAIQDIFGLKGGKVVKADIASFEHLVSEWERLSKLSPNERFAQFVERFGNAQDKIRLQLDIMRELRTQLSQTFITAATGAKDFASALKEINQILQDMKPVAEAVGKALYWVVVNPVKQAGNVASITSTKIKETGVSNDAFTNKKRIIENLRKQGMNLDESFLLTSMGEAELMRLAARNSASRRGPAMDLGKVTVTGGETQKDTPQYQKEITVTLQDRLALMERLKVLGLNDLQVEMKKLELVERQGTADEIHEQRLKVALQINKELVQTAQEFEKAFQSAFANLMDGKGDFFKDLSTSIRNVFRDAFAEAMTDKLFQATGIGDTLSKGIFKIKHLGDRFGIKTSFDYGAEATQKAIETGFKNGVDIMNGKSPTASGGKDSMGLLGQLLGGTPAIPGQGGYGANTPKGVKNMGNYSQLPGKGGMMSKLGGMLSTGAGLLGAGLAGYGQYQALGGSEGSLALPSGILTGVGGALLMTPFAPIGAAMMGVGMIMGMFNKRKKTEVQEQTREIRLGSKIDITNKELEFVNRNLIALRATMETYIMPESAYFSEKRNLEDEFSMSSRRG